MPKGIILAGGLGTRLHPLTLTTSKQLLPIYDKPMVYYALSTLMAAGIDDVLLVSTPQHLILYQQLLGDGSAFGIRFTYLEQAHPGGIAHVFLIAEAWINHQPCALILGDNVFIGGTFDTLLNSLDSAKSGATVFVKRVSDPERFGVLYTDTAGKPNQIIEKPSNPTSNLAITGLYFYDGTATRRATQLKPSARGELEISDLNHAFLQEDQLDVIYIPDETSWFDTGTFDALLHAAVFIQNKQNEQNQVIGSPQMMAVKQGWISTSD